MSALEAGLDDLEAPWTRARLIDSMGRRLRAAGLETASREAAWLFAHVTGVERAGQVSWPDAPVLAIEATAALDLVARRAGGEPFQYLVGSAPFFGREFAVDPSVLIPRPETEGLVEAALSRMAPGDRFLDVGTGSGCIAVTIALEVPESRADACDLSEAALATGARNAERLGAAVRFLVADALSDGFVGQVTSPYDLVISNPPYIPDREAAGLQREVVGHEPAMALFSGDDPLKFHRRLARLAFGGLLRPGGWLLCELYDDTGAAAADDWRAAGLVDVTVRPDLAGRERVIEGRVPIV